MKIFWNYILLFVLLLCLSVSYGQCVFHKLCSYNPTELDFGRAVIQSNDGGYITVGNAFINSGTDGVFVVKTDECGDTLWQTAINLNTIGGCPGHSVVELPDNNIVVCGSRTDMSDTLAHTYLLKLNSLGDTVWLKTIKVEYADLGLIHKRTADGGFIIGGYSMDSTLISTQVFLIKTDSIGFIEWQQEYGDIGYNDYIESFDFTPDGGYIIGGDFENPVTGGWDLYLLKTDSLGNEQWREYYDEGIDQGGGFAISTLDGGYIITGAVELISNDASAHIIKTDSTGGVIWSKTYDLSNKDEYFKFVRQQQDSTYIIAGAIPDLTTVNGRKVWLLKMDTNGDTLWTKSYTYYGENTHTYVEDLQLTNDGGFVMTGYIAGNPRPNKNDLWLLKTDSLGNTCQIDTTTWEGCSELVSVVEIKDNNESEIILIYPNPAEEYITIESYDQVIRKVEISNIHGSIVRLVCNINTGIENINLSELRTGLYFVRVHCDQFVKTLKIVKQ